MPTDRAWTIKGVRDETREAVREAARDAGLSIGTWVDRALADAARRGPNPPQPQPAAREDVAQAVRDVLTKQGTADQERDPSPVEAMRARMRRRRGWA